MKIKVIISMLLVLVMSMTAVVATSQSEETDEQVWVCTGSRSACYHRVEKCRGLMMCSSEVRLVPLKSAQILGRRQCSFCYKKNASNVKEDQSTTTNDEGETKDIKE